MQEKFFRKKWNKLTGIGYSLMLGLYCNMVQWLQHFLDALRSWSLGDSCGEAAGNVLFFLYNGLVKGVAAGAACLDETDLVLFGLGVSATALPPEVPLFLLPVPLGLARVGLLGVCCDGARVGASAACPLAMIVVMISSRFFVSVGVRVTLAVTASSSASICSAASSEAWWVSTFS